jgi:hypothetical protein
MKNKEIKDLSEEYKGDNQFVWMLKAYGKMIHRMPALVKHLYIDPLVALGKATTRRPILVNQSGKRTSLKTKDSRWFFDDPKYGTAGQGYLPIWHYIPRKGFVDAHEGAKYYGLLDGVNAVDQDVLDKSNRDLQDILRVLQKSRKKRIEKGKEVLNNPWKDAEDPFAGTGFELQKERKKMKITKEELANIIKEEVEKALGEEAESDEGMEAIERLVQHRSLESVQDDMQRVLENLFAGKGLKMMARSNPYMKKLGPNVYKVSLDIVYRKQ